MTDKIVGLPDEVVLSKIYMIRNQKVMLDSDLAELYGVETRVLNQAIKRNIVRFPDSFMFQLSEEEWNALISQFVISNEGRGGRRKLEKWCYFWRVSYTEITESEIKNSL